MNRNIKEFRLPIILTIACAVLIAVISLIPLGGLLYLSRTDKAWHFVAFFCLVIPFVVTKPSSVKWIIPIAGMYGGLIEYIQPYVNRKQDLFDFSANVMGIFAGALVGFLINKFFSKCGGSTSVTKPNQTT